VVGVASEDVAQERLSFRDASEAEVCLGLEEKRGGPLPEFEVVVEEEHRGQRRGEVVDPGLGLWQLPGVCQQLAKKLLGLQPLPKFLPREGRVAGLLAECTNGHLLEVAFEGGSGEPVSAGLGGIAAGGQRAAEPVMDVALVGEEMLGLAQILGRGQDGFEMLAGLGALATSERVSAQRQVRSHPLAEGATLPSAGALFEAGAPLDFARLIFTEPVVRPLPGRSGR
jgi:hypothetical protein